MPVPPDYPRVPPPPMRQSQAKIDADQNRAARRIDRRLGSARAARVGDDGLLVFAGRRSRPPGGHAWVDVANATTFADIIRPTLFGWWAVDIAWQIQGADPGDVFRATGNYPGVSTSAPGGAHARIEADDGTGAESRHIEGGFGPAEFGLEIGISTDSVASWSAQVGVTGRFVHQRS